MLHVLIVDDSATTRQLLRYIINNAMDMRVVDEAQNGREAVRKVAELRPDVVVMDVIMPGMDGMEATAEIMHSSPVPIILISTSAEEHGTEFAFKAMKLGALSLLPKPAGPGDARYETQAARLLSTIRTMAAVKVIHHRKPRTAVLRTAKRISWNGSMEIVAIASSTGGPAALSEILQRLPADFPAPIVIAQHITGEFIPSLCNWLNSITALNVVTAERGGKPEAGTVYLATGEANLILNTQRRFDLEYSNTRFIPSGDVLFESIATNYGLNSVGVILTGMGSDGASGLRQIYDMGGFTIAQDEMSSAVFGMPREAIARGAARIVSPLLDIADTLQSLVKVEDR